MNNSDDKKQVFISYAKEDIEIIEKLCLTFKKNDIGYWIDREKISPGQIWKTAIKEAINDGAYFLSCFSKQYEEKIKTYMNEEILVAIECMRSRHFNEGWFIPAKLSKCKIPGLPIGAGYTLQDLHYLEFYKDWTASLERLVDMIKRKSTAVESTSEGFSENCRQPKELLNLYPNNWCIILSLSFSHYCISGNGQATLRLKCICQLLVKSFQKYCITYEYQIQIVDMMSVGI